MLAMEPEHPSDPLDLSKLSPSERQVFERARSGATAVDIARELSVTEATVRTHLSHIYEKLGVRGRLDLLARLQRSSPPPAVHSLPHVEPLDAAPAVPSVSEVGGWRLTLMSAVGAAVGIAAGFAALPATALAPPAVLLLPLLAGAPIAVVIARRPGGLHFFGTLAGACGAILVALAFAPAISCPAGEFSSECVRPAVTPILLPGLSLMIVGLLLVGRAIRRPIASVGATRDIPAR
jgi:DNA-binding CsgD family transcriptional regulator